MSTRTELDVLMTQLEEMWSHQDTLFNIITASNDWGHKHGADWTFADVPYHLAYCNRDLVARGIELGPNLPADEQESLSTLEAISAWNKRKFAERAAGQTAEQSLTQVRASWDDIRRETAAMTDADLERPFWLPILGAGWVTARHGLQWGLGHDWSEFMQLRIHMGRTKPVPSAAITTYYLGAMIGFLPMFLNKESAAGVEFTAVFTFTDPGVSAYTIHVVDGVATVARGRAENAHLVMTQSAETYEKTVRGIQKPGEAIQSGAIQVSNPEGLATFGKLFPM